MRTITLNERQPRAVELLTRLPAGALDVATAAERLGVSVRQVRWRRERFREAGMAAVLHGTSGRAPANRTAPALLAGIVALAGPGGQYHDLNGCHLHELLAREAQIVSGRATLERLLKPTGMRQPAQTAPPVQRRRRLRRSAEGMRLQIAGSACAWLAARAAPADLIGAIAHATGTGLLLHFRPSQDQVGYLRLLRSIAQDDGLPMSLYHDRHTSLRSPKQPTLEEQLAGHMPLRQVQRGMAALGIESSAAYAPQAKDRLERVWGTRQERLTKGVAPGRQQRSRASPCLPARLHGTLPRALRPSAPGSADSRGTPTR